MPNVNPALEEIRRRRGEEFRLRLKAFVQAKVDVGQEAEVTDGAIARASKVDRSTVSRILSGERIATADQISAIAAALNAPALIPPEPVVGAGSPQQEGGFQPTSGLRSRLPPGLEGFLERHGKRLKITRRERVYLERDRTETDAWLRKDDGYWERRLKFWREELAIQDRASGIDSPEDSE
jgi:transcriptional regulator with XRE-family HTH domain